MESLIQRLSQPSYAIPVALFALYSIYSRLSYKSSVPPGIPWVGKSSSGLFAETRATFASFSNVCNWLGEGYEKVWLFQCLMESAA